MQFNRVARQQPENTILIVITGGSKLDNAMINLFRRAYRVNNWRLAGTIEEARASIYQDRLASSQA
ncbi:MAG: hypothetical protein JNJ61_29640 [Anaerolineae bacterium]|nr:hypothetical protein [Anaerolineae bacterium]